MNCKFFKVEIEQKVAKVSINRPKRANALHIEAWEELRYIFNSISSNEGVRVAILFGEGKHFCSGIDLELLMSVQNFNKLPCSGKRSEMIRQLIKTLQEAINAIEKCTKPVLAAIHNGCIGGGLDIVTACDIRYCTEESYFTVKEIDMGMVADLGTLQRLPKIISSGRVAEMAYTGKQVFGKEAKDIGLVNQCFPSRELLMDGVFKVALLIASKSPLSIRGTKEVLRFSRKHSVEDGLNFVATWNAGMLLSNDLNEAFSASVEKRQPNFEN